MGTRGRKSRAELSVVPFQTEAIRPQTDFDPPSPPDHLGEPERPIWRRIFRDYGLSADVATAVLATALEAAVMSEARDCLMFIVFLSVPLSALLLRMLRRAAIIDQERAKRRPASEAP